MANRGLTSCSQLLERWCASLSAFSFRVSYYKGQGGTHLAAVYIHNLLFNMLMVFLSGLSPVSGICLTYDFYGLLRPALGCIRLDQT